MPRGAKPIPGPLSRVIGSILRARLTRLDVPAGAIGTALGISDDQVRRLLRAARHMDVEQLYVICGIVQLDIRDVIDEAIAELGNAPERLTSTRRVKDHTSRVAADVTATRVRVAIAKLFPGGAEASAPLILPALSAAGVPLSSDEWSGFLNESGTVALDDRALEVIGAALGLQPSYFTTSNPDDIERGEADIELRQAMEETGVTQIAARSVDRLSTDAIRAVTEMIRSTKTEGSKG